MKPFTAGAVVSEEGLRLRTRYNPRNRIGQGLIAAAPWLDFTLLVLFYLLLAHARLVLQPGVVVDLPSAEFSDGLHPGLVAVVLSHPVAGGGAREEQVFFNDQRYLARDPLQMEALGQALAQRARQSGESDLTLHADRHVDHGTVMKLMEAARRAGLARVNVSVRTE